MEPFNVYTQARWGQVVYNRHDLVVGRSLDLYGEWAESEIALFLQVLQPGMIVVDAGANVGTHTLPLARAVGPTGAVYAFEPQRIVFQTLAANVAINSLTNVICQQRALGEMPAIALVPPVNYGMPNDFGRVALTSPGSGAAGEARPPGEPVEVVRLDDYQLPACHLVKIDVEGMELEVLRGAAETIARCQPLLYVDADRLDQHDDLIRFLDERGYAMYWHHVPFYNPSNFRADQTNVFADAASTSLLAIPSTVPQNIDGLERVAVPPRDPSSAAGGSTGALPTGQAGAQAPGEAERLRATLERGVMHHQAGQRQEARAFYEMVLQARPDEPDALHLLGLLHGDERRLDEALASLERAVAAAPAQPVFQFSLGSVQRQLGLLDEAEASFWHVLELSPGSVEALRELGLTLLERRDLGAAEETLHEALALAPDHAASHTALAGLLLLTGRYEEGWRELEWRWRLPELIQPQPATQAPLWDGTPLDGRTILLEAEHSHGDMFQLARYVPLVAARGGRVVLRCRPEIEPVMRTLDGVAELVAPVQPLPPHDSMCSLPDLPRLFGTTLDTIPGQMPYLHAEPDRVRLWRARIVAADQPGAPAPRLRVGLIWAGSADHRQDAQRSIRLAMLAPLGAVPGVRFYGLQKEAGADEALSPPPGLDFVDLGPGLADFADTAAVLSVLDLVVTVDTAAGHLAGALGRPVWVLLWATHDWHWLLDREDTPWYPTMRLFRQERPNAWEPVIARVEAALRDGAGANDPS